MIFFAIMRMLAVSLQVHQCTDLACHARFQESRIGSECVPCLDRGHVGIIVLWSSASSLFRYRVVVVFEAPSCSLNNVHIVQPHRVCHLASLLDVISNLCFR